MRLRFSARDLSSGIPVYRAIALVVVVFNLIAVLGLNALLRMIRRVLLDRKRRLSVDAVEPGAFSPGGSDSCSTDDALVPLPGPAGDPTPVHGSNLMALLLPVHHKFGLDPVPSFAASVLPNILPSQDLIPGFVVAPTRSTGCFSHSWQSPCLQVFGEGNWWLSLAWCRRLELLRRITGDGAVGFPLSACRIALLFHSGQEGEDTGLFLVFS